MVSKVKVFNLGDTNHMRLSRPSNGNFRTRCLKFSVKKVLSQRTIRVNSRNKICHPFQENLHAIIPGVLNHTVMCFSCGSSWLWDYDGSERSHDLESPCPLHGPRAIRDQRLWKDSQSLLGSLLRQACIGIGVSHRFAPGSNNWIIAVGCDREKGGTSHSRFPNAVSRPFGERKKPMIQLFAFFAEPPFRFEFVRILKSLWVKVN